MSIAEVILFIIFAILYLAIAFWPISLPFFIYYLYKKSQNKKLLKSNVVYKSWNNSSSNVQDAYVDIDSYKLEHFDSNGLGVLKNYFSNLIIAFEKSI